MPGIGKTTLAKSIATLDRLQFRRIQFTPDVMPSDITGINFYNQKAGEFEFRPGPIMANIVLADEINRATPRTQSALLEAMEERQVTVEGVTLSLPAPFLVHRDAEPNRARGHVPAAGGAARPLLHAHQPRLPGRRRRGRDPPALRGGQPAGRTCSPWRRTRSWCASARWCRSIYCEPSVRRYIVQLVQATRKHAAYELGASPRGSLGLYKGARALAAIRGRDYVLPDDVKFLAPYVLTHRAILNSQSRLRGRDAAGVLEEIIESVAGARRGVEASRCVTILSPNEAWLRWPLLPRR